MTYATSRVEGLAELRRVLDALPKQVGARVARGAVWDSARVLTTDARELAAARLHRKRGNLFRGITQQNLKGKPGTFTVGIGFSRRAAHGPLLEFGTAARYTKKGAYRGVGSAYRFMTDAWYSKRDEAAQALRTALRARLEREAARLAAATGRR